MNLCVYGEHEHYYFPTNIYKVILYIVTNIFYILSFQYLNITCIENCIILVYN